MLRRPPARTNELYFALTVLGVIMMSNRLSVPDHPQVARGTLRALISRAGLTVEEFLAAVRA